MIDISKIAEMIESVKPYPEIQSKILANDEGLTIQVSGHARGKEYRTSRIFRWAELSAMYVPYLYLQDEASSLMNDIVEASRL